MRADKQIVVTDEGLGHRGVEASGCMLEPKANWRVKNILHCRHRVYMKNKCIKHGFSVETIGDKKVSIKG